MYYLYPNILRHATYQTYSIYSSLLSGSVLPWEDSDLLGSGSGPRILRDSRVRLQGFLHIQGDNIHFWVDSLQLSFSNLFIIFGWQQKKSSIKVFYLTEFSHFYAYFLPSLARVRNYRNYGNFVSIFNLILAKTIGTYIHMLVLLHTPATALLTDHSLPAGNCKLLWKFSCI